MSEASGETLTAPPCQHSSLELCHRRGRMLEGELRKSGSPGLQTLLLALHGMEKCPWRGMFLFVVKAVHMPGGKVIFR